VRVYTCASCRFSLAQPLAELRASWLGFFDDARFPGRGVLVLKRHVEHFAELDPETTLAFMLDCQKAARAIGAATGAKRMNYAMLGNVEPHLHMHVIPRLVSDPIPLRTPWEHLEPQTPLPVEQAQRWMDAIRARLEHR